MNEEAQLDQRTADICLGDRFQNHALHDVRSKNYDRRTYTPEKRADMDKWNEFVTALLATKKRAVAA